MLKYWKQKRSAERRNLVESGKFTAVFIWFKRSPPYRLAKISFGCGFFGACASRLSGALAILLHSPHILAR